MYMSNTPPRPISRCQAITDMIDSVAKEQAALSRILSAEADKMEKIISITCAHAPELFKTNQSVNRLINSITRLEMVLQSKLELFGDCLCTCPIHPMDDDMD